MDCRAVIKGNDFSLCQLLKHTYNLVMKKTKKNMFFLLFFFFLGFFNCLGIHNIFKKKDRIKWLPQGVPTFLLGYKQQKTTTTYCKIKVHKLYKRF